MPKSQEIKQVKEHKSPRISANDLAQYMVSSTTMQMSIIRRNKFPPAYIVTRYQDVRKGLVDYLSSVDRDPAILAQLRGIFEAIKNDPNTPTSKAEDALLSIAVLKSFEAANNALGLGAISFSPVGTKLKPLMLEGVRVSAPLDLLVSRQIKGEPHGGGAILRLAKADDSEPAKQKRDEMGQFAATIIRMQIEAKKPSGLPVHPTLCMSIDVQHNKKYAAGSAVRRINDLKAACGMIAAVWPSVEQQSN